jgi:anti-anti-sigma regulatory factor
VGSGEIVLPEELSERTWKRCATGAAAALDTAEGNLIVECSELVRFDEHGIAMLVGLAHYSEVRQVKVVLVNPPITLRAHLETTGMAWFFEWRPLVV